MLLLYPLAGCFENENYQVRQCPIFAKTHHNDQINNDQSLIFYWSLCHKGYHSNNCRFLLLSNKPNFLKI